MPCKYSCVDYLLAFRFVLTLHWFYAETSTSPCRSGWRGEDSCHYFAPKSLSSDNYPALRSCFCVVPSSPLGTSTTPHMTLGGRAGPTAGCKLPLVSPCFFCNSLRLDDRPQQLLCSTVQSSCWAASPWNPGGAWIQWQPLLFTSGLCFCEVLTINKMEKSQDRDDTLCSQTYSFKVWPQLLRSVESWRWNLDRDSTYDPGQGWSKGGGDW